MSLLFLALLPLLLSLGFWQLERAAEKRGYLTSLIEAQGMLPLPLAADMEPAPFERVKLEGRFEADRQFLLDNQVRDGQVGYWAVSSFVDGDGGRWLVNRGWLPAPSNRQELPELAVPDAVVSITAVAWPDLGLPPLAGEDVWSERWPKRVQRLDVDRMAALLEGARPLQLRLEAEQPGALAPLPLTVAMQPEKHTGYAVQWFVMAAVLCVAYGCYGFGMTLTGRRTREHDANG